MKSHTLTTLIICLLTLNTFSQTEKIKTVPEDVPKYTIKIELTNEMTESKNFDYVIETLLDNDYVIDKSDKEFGTIKTDPKFVRKASGSHYFNIRVKDNKIIVIGQSITRLNSKAAGVETEDSYEYILNIGANNSPSKQNFLLMYKFAHLLGFSNIEYKL